MYTSRGLTVGFGLNIKSGKKVLVGSNRFGKQRERTRWDVRPALQRTIYLNWKDRLGILYRYTV